MTRIDWRQQSLVKRSNVVDTARMLLIADAYPLLKARYTLEQIAELLAVPVQGGVSAEARLQEAMTVGDYWDGWVLQIALECGAHWHTLTEPPRWDDVARLAVFDFVKGYATRTGRWPSVGDMRRRFGRVSNHRLPGEQEGQGTLEVEA